MPDRQSEVIAFLSDPRTHGGARPDVVQTHAALVFLAGDAAWKMKRAVRYDYLDFTALETRRAMLERELELNRPAAPQIYREVLPVTEGPEGLRVGGDGPAVEWVLRMSRFDTDMELSRIAERGELDLRLAFDLGRAVAAMHDRAERRHEDGATLAREIVEELAEAFSGMRGELGAVTVEEISHALREAHGAQSALLTERGNEGHVRRCHGDLHLHNIVLLDGAPVPFDALEFDERLGTCDVAYDLAFLLMDLRHRGLAAQAGVTLATWATARGGAEDAGLAALPLFLAMRACIRAMVLIQTDRAAGHPGRSDIEARAYVGEALEALRDEAPRLVAIGGRSGSGKTTMARHMAPALAPVGAVHLSSDLERKEMLGAGPFDRLPQGAYAPEVSARLYARLMARARIVLNAGRSVILDATFLDPAQRAAAVAVARQAGVRFDGLWLDAPAPELTRRVTARTRDASDADAAVVETQTARPAPSDWTLIDARGTKEAVAARLAAALRARD